MTHLMKKIDIITTHFIYLRSNKYKQNNKEMKKVFFRSS